MVVDADKTYSVLVDGKRVPRLNHHRYINSVIRRFFQEIDKYPDISRELVVPEGVASRHELPVVLSLVVSNELTANVSADLVLVLKTEIAGEAGLEKVSEREITRHAAVSCQDVFDELAVLTDKKLSYSEILDVMQLAYPQGIYVPPLSY